MTEIEATLTFANGRRHAVVARVVDGDVPDAIEAMNLAVEMYLDDFPDGPELKGEE